MDGWDFWHCMERRLVWLLHRIAWDWDEYHEGDCLALAIRIGTVK
jgi:hypothetical protein